MKSQTSLAARNCRLQEWSKMVHSYNNRPIPMNLVAPAEEPCIKKLLPESVKGSS